MPIGSSPLQTGILALEGEIDLHRSPQVKETLEPLIQKKMARILVDLSAVSYIDSSGLAIFIETMQRIAAYGGKFALFGLRESVRGIFEIARLDQIFNIYPDETSAVAEV
jgi:anti-sigma B factor antagonist